MYKIFNDSYLSYFANFFLVKSNIQSQNESSFYSRIITSLNILALNTCISSIKYIHCFSDIIFSSSSLSNAIVCHMISVRYHRIVYCNYVGGAGNFFIRIFLITRYIEEFLFTNT